MSETVAAIASPAGPGAIAVLRVSGPATTTVAMALLGERGASLEERRATLATARDAQGDVIDEVLATRFAAPRSYTGEDVLELSCHGGILVTRRLLDRLVECGARVAAPGEFTQRAFFNGKMDLTQAEAVMDVIAAQTDLALKAAQHQLEGLLGEATEGLRRELLESVAHLEAYIDFPEEDIDPDGAAQIAGRLGDCERRIAALLATAEQGRLLRHGVRTVIYGTPNVGKSSLLNVLLGADRAIVSEIPGTTRDTVEEVIDLGGIPVRLIDTAGMRETADVIERHGVERTRRHLAEADLILEVVDGSVPPGERLAEEARSGRHHLLVINKVDLGRHPAWDDAPGVEISCLERTGLEDLTAAMKDELALGAGAWGREAVAVNARHQACLRRAQEALGAARRQLDAGTGPEFVAVDLREALEAVGEIAGRVDTEEILGEIFGRFCIGK
ncbi:MAG: tRNA uridine-5-carboxymethylaminomethyl(34) synthesis GTPase MnmE [Akkermansiaceae bacterium]|nr:tRNA uridine-5-carboxymethylaminomethyl(34) synthesis GTPase MnmE [Akkermansiaceae bacterium]